MAYQRWRCVGLTAALLLTVAAITVTTAQTVPSIPAPTAPAVPGVPATRVAGTPYQVDLVTLVKDAQVTAATVSDGVWNAAPAADRQLLLIPLRLKAVTQPTEVTNDGAKLVGGRFIAFFIPEGGRVGAGVAGGGGEFGGEDFAEFDQGLDAGNPGVGGGLAGLGGGLGGATGPQVDVAPPRMTRDLTLHPEGRITWKLSRGIPGAEVIKSQNKAYALYLDRSQIVRPVPPTAARRASGGEDFDGERQRIDPAQRRAAQEQMRQQQAVYQQEVNAYNQLVRLIGQLPTEFSEPAPPIIYAVYDFPKLLPRISMTGEAPLPLELRVDQFTALRQIAAGQGDARAIAAVLMDIAGNQQPVNLSLAAASLSGSNQLAAITPDNPLMRLIEPMMTKADRTARMALVDALGTNANATASPFASVVLQKAMTDPEPLVALTALKASMAQNQGRVDPNQLTQVAAAISNMLKSPEAPPMAESLGLLMQVSGSGGGAESSLPLQLLSSQVKLAATPPQRRPEMVNYVVAHARRNQPLAARWVDQQLLGSGDIALQVLTLEAIAAGEGPMLAGGQQVAGQGGYERQGPGRNMPWQQMGMFNAAGDAQYNSGIEEEPVMEDFEGGGGQMTGGAFMPTGPAGPIPIERVDHAILPLLASADQTLRPAAWAALPHFAFSQNQNLPPDGFYQAVAAAAVATKPTPAEAGTILNGNLPSQLAGLSRIVSEGEGPGRFTAARALALNAPGELLKALVAMSPDARHDLTAWWYKLPDATGVARLNAPAFVGLIRQQGVGDAPSPVVPWFIQQLQQRHTPPGANDWITGAGGEAGVVAGLTSTDKKYAEAGAAALVGSIAWPTPEGMKTLQDQVAKATLGVRDVALQQKKADEAWKLAKPKIIAALTPQIAGNYKAEVRIATVATPNEMPKPPVAVAAAVPGEEYIEEPMEEYIEEFEGGGGMAGFNLGPVPSGPPPTPMYSVDCGQITLTVNGTNVQVSPLPLTLTISSDPVLAMKLAQPGQVMVLLSGKTPPPGFALPSQPIEFVADAYGNFLGTGWTPDARRIEVSLVRVQ